MSLITKSMNVLLAACCLAGCSSNKQTVEITVTNSTDLNRENEMVEIPVRNLEKLAAANGEWVVTDAQHNQVPYQITHDSLLIFPATVGPNQAVVYTVSAGVPEKVDTIACGKMYPNRLDAIAWENDKAAYRAYGPALQKTGEKSYGYDVFTKSVSEPVVEQRYKMETDSATIAQIRLLREQGQKEKADSLLNTKSYHVDHGNGMDCYSVGATLGGGTAALMEDSTIIYPYCYKEYAILDNGPLRFSVKLTYHPSVVKNDSNVVETRIITLDKGSYLNKTEIRYENLSGASTVVTGIVLHPQHPDGYAFSTEERYIAYADSTNNTQNNNGVIFVGAAFEPSLENTGVQWFSEEEKAQRPGAIGHLLGYTTYQPGASYVYYWGSGWSKADMPDMETWKQYLKEYARKIEKPLHVEVK